MSEGKAMISLSEYEHLKKIRHEHEKLLKDLSVTDNSIIIEATLNHGWYHRYHITNPDKVMRDLQSDVDSNRERLENLRNTPIPMFNFKRKKVKDL